MIASLVAKRVGLASSSCQSRRKLEHGAEEVVFRQAIVGGIKQAIIAWDGVCAITPDEAHQVDPLHHAVMFPRPVAMHQRNLLGRACPKITAHA